jgi:hypothetical protein
MGKENSTSSDVLFSLVKISGFVQRKSCQLRLPLWAQRVDIYFGAGYGSRFAFSLRARINVRLRRAVGGNAHPRCI